MKSKYDSQQFNYADMAVQVGSRVLAGLRAVRYKDSQEMEYVYGAGNKPLAIQLGNVSYDGELKILQNELEVLIEQAPNRRLQELEDMQITITYNKDDVLVTDILTGVRFTEVEKALEQGAKFMEVTLPFMMTAVKFNV